MHSRLVLADAAETKLCAWLSVSTFAGLLAYAFSDGLGRTPRRASSSPCSRSAKAAKSRKGELVEDND